MDQGISRPQATLDLSTSPLEAIDGADTRLSASYKSFISPMHMINGTRQQGQLRFVDECSHFAINSAKLVIIHCVCHASFP